MNLYGIFIDDGNKWALATNKRQALRFAKERGGYVTQMRYPESNSWDAPTFKVCSDMIADFRVTR